MGDMREEYEAINEHRKQTKLERNEKIISFLKLSKDCFIFDYVVMNESQGHYRLDVNGYKIDVWSTTGKFTIVGTNKYSQGLDKLKNVIDSTNNRPRTGLKKAQTKGDSILYKFEVLNELERDARNEILDLKDTCGVYILYEFDKIVYVGVSVNLSQRILSSMTDKSDTTSFSYVDTDSLSDAYILEILLINIIKPKYNEQSLGDGEISFELPIKYEYKDLPKFYKKTTVN